MQACMSMPLIKKRGTLAQECKNKDEKVTKMWNEKGCPNRPMLQVSLSHQGIKNEE